MISSINGNDTFLHVVFTAVPSPQPLTMAIFSMLEECTFLDVNILHIYFYYYLSYYLTSMSTEAMANGLTVTGPIEGIMALAGISQGGRILTTQYKVWHSSLPSMASNLY